MSTLAQIGTSFIAPALATAGAAAISIPILIHLLSRIRRRTEHWGAMRFLLEAYRRHKQRLRFEQWLLLLVRCLIVLVLGLALAGPLLSGCASRLVGGLDASGRSIHIVIDDTLTTQAKASGDVTRFDELRNTALTLVDASGPDDTIFLWRSAQPIEGPVETSAAVRDALKSMSPRYSRSGLSNALYAIDETLDARPAIVVLLSDFSRSVENLDRPLPRELEGLSDRARILVSRPGLGADNVQVMRLAPRRRMVLASPQEVVNVPIELHVRRFDGGTTAASASVEVALIDVDGGVLASTTRRPRWATGQAVANLNLDLPVEPGLAASDGRTGRSFILRARLDPQRMTDALLVDDERLAVVEVRHRLNVGVVDEVIESFEGLSPDQWLSLALSPMAGESTIVLERLLPADVRDEVLRRLDAVMVLRPGLLPDLAWQRLSAFAQAGGVVWVFVPPLHTTALWTRPMSEAFALRWRIEMEPRQAADDRPLWALEVDTPVPDGLGALAADWEALLRPVRVAQRLPVSAEDAQTWLALSGDAEDGAVLAVQRAGNGALLFLTTALDPQWTNLPTKPLFVPLLHESLRSLLGDAADGSDHVLAGVMPQLGGAWIGVTELAPIDGDGPSIALRASADGVEAIEPIVAPGAYRAAGAPGRILAVNVSADAGDTRIVSEHRLSQWLDAMGGWSFLDADNPGVALAQHSAPANLSWPLLWVTLGLILLETVLARTMSHAHVGSQRTWTARLLQSVKRIRHEQINDSGVKPEDSSVEKAA